MMFLGIVIHLFIILSSSQVTGKYSLTFQFHRYSNPSLRDAVGECCDFALFSCGHCETLFQSLCLRAGSSSNTATGLCISDTIRNPGEVGGDIIEFHDSIGSLDNPFTFTGNTIPQVGYQLYLEVYDIDTVTDNDLLDRVVVPVAGRPMSVESATYVGIFGRVSLVLSYTLSCKQHYYGTDCSVNCIPRNDVENGHYTCNSTTGAIICRDGWQNTTNNCRDVACQLVCQLSSGNCTVDGVCKCVEGWSGEHCDIPRCKEGCHPPGGYCEVPDQCLCRTNWNGTLCNVSLCETNCSSIGGMCTIPTECTCLTGYTGQACETDLLPCVNEMPCDNDGNCSHTQVPGDYTCTCLTGFTGSNCETDIDECSIEEPCLNNGTCLNGEPGTFKCICSIGWTGESCEERIDYCESSPCSNNGTCNSLPTGYYCHCIDQFEGLNCERYVNACLPNPCQNNGTCTNLITNYTCDCTEGFTGHNCATNVSVATNATNNQGNSTSEPSKVDASIIGAAAGGGGLLLIIVIIVAIATLVTCIVMKKRWKSNNRRESYSLVGDKMPGKIIDSEVEYDVPDKDLLRTLPNIVYGDTSDTDCRYTYAKLNRNITSSSQHNELSDDKKALEMEPLYLNSGEEKQSDSVPNPVYGGSHHITTTTSIADNPVYGGSDITATTTTTSTANNPVYGGSVHRSVLEKGEEGMYSNPLYGGGGGGGTQDTIQPTYESI